MGLYSYELMVLVKHDISDRSFYIRTVYKQIFPN